MIRFIALTLTILSVPSLLWAQTSSFAHVNKNKKLTGARIAVAGNKDQSPGVFNYAKRNSKWGAQREKPQVRLNTKKQDKAARSFNRNRKMKNTRVEHKPVLKNRKRILYFD